ncbi:MAG: CNNM domain-containing protein [Planctomycetota bacterium]
MSHVAVALFLIGLAMSAFYSGNETGLYRVSRTRVVLDALSGSATGRALLWLLNRPPIFIATTLVGNNLANYLTSLAIVMWVGSQVTASVSGQPDVTTAQTLELASTILMTPAVFVFGELMPKHLFYQAPYRLLSLGRVGLLLSTLLFAPVSAILGLLGRALSSITGQTAFRLPLSMGRNDLDQVLRVGQEAGLLTLGQREFSQQLFDVGNQPAISFGVRLDRLAIVTTTDDLETIRRRARRNNHPIILVREDADASGSRIVGFYHYADLLADDCVPEPQPVVTALAEERHLGVLLRLYDEHSDVAILTEGDGLPVGAVTRRQLVQSLL